MTDTTAAKRNRGAVRFASVFMTLGQDHVRVGWKVRLRRGGRWHYWLTDNRTAKAIANHKAAAVASLKGTQTEEAGA